MASKFPVLAEIYIGQTEKWPFLSPMRIIRSLRQDLPRIPVNVGKYQKSIYSKLCVNISTLEEFRVNPRTICENYIDSLASNIKLFNNTSEKKYVEVKNRIEEIISDSRNK